MAWDHEGSRHDRGYGWEWVKLRGRILDRDQHLCQACYRKGRITEAREVDHIVPKAQDGTDEDENLEAICTPCHKAKTQAERQGARRVTFGEDGWPIG